MRRQIFLASLLFLSLFAAPSEALPDVEEFDDVLSELNAYDEHPRTFNAPSSGAFNTSVAFTIPLFSFTLPDLGGDGALDAPSLITLGLLSFLLIAFAATVPLIGNQLGFTTIPTSPTSFPGFLFGRSIRDVNGQVSIFSQEGMTLLGQYMVTFVENSLSRIPSVDGGQCVQRTVCEAYSKADKYGLLSLPIQLLFPPEFEVQYPNQYAMAARVGQAQPETCPTRYRCGFSIMDGIYSATSTLGHYLRRK